MVINEHLKVRYMVRCINPDITHFDNFIWEFYRSQSGSKSKDHVPYLIGVATDNAPREGLKLARKGSRWFFQLGSFSGVIQRLKKGELTNIEEERVPEVWAL